MKWLKIGVPVVLAFALLGAGVSWKFPDEELYQQKAHLAVKNPSNDYDKMMEQYKEMLRTPSPHGGYTNRTEIHYPANKDIDPHKLKTLKSLGIPSDWEAKWKGEIYTIKKMMTYREYVNTGIPAGVSHHPV